MSRTAKKINIKEIRSFTDRNKVSDWLPSIGGDFVNTFTLNGENDDGSNSKGEINKNTIFGKGVDPLGKPYDNTSVVDQNLKRFYLSMHCLKQPPYSNGSLFGPVDDKSDDILFTGDLSKFYFDYQTAVGTNSTLSRSLTCDAVRYYRKNKAKNISEDDVKNEKIFTQLIKFAQETKGDYQNNVAGVLGRVTYDSVVKHTLYNVLLDNGLVVQKEKNSISWTEEASKLDKSPDIYVDVGGGPYVRAFPTAIFIVKDKSGKKLNDLINIANDLAGNTFSRKLNSTEQLVTPIGDKEQNFISIPLRNTGDSVYCIIYDLAKILVLPPISGAGFMIDLLRIGLSFLSRMPSKNYTKDTFKKELNSIKDYLNKNFGELQDSYIIRFQTKHTLECAYSSSEDSTVTSGIVSETFTSDIKNLCTSLEKVYNNILSKLPDNFTLHFDNFYNLLAITSSREEQGANPKNYPEDVPFDLKQYDASSPETDLVPKFFKKPETLNKSDIYSFTPDYALSSNIHIITDVFIKQLYSILDSNSSGIPYETDENSVNDNIKKLPTINLLELINQRTGYNLLKDDYFTVSNNVPSLKFNPSGVTTINIDKDLALLFDSVKSNRIKFQTLNHFLYVERIKNPDQDSFKDIIYYPRLEQVQPDIKKEEPKVPITNPKKATKSKDRDFLINNIISSELACYEDIANSFDKAMNAEKSSDKVYYAWQTVSNIALPMLLAYVSQMIAAKINELSKKSGGLDSGLAECVSRDSEKIKKTIIGYADLLSNLENPQQLIGLLFQEIPEIPQLPYVQYLLTFDAEKELKRKAVQFVIDKALKIVKFQLGAVLKAFIDICNSDSYLTAFLDSAFNSNKDENNKKLGTSSPSGLPIGNISPVYVPKSLLNINDLIEKSGIESKENVYEFFRIRFAISKQEFSNEKISLFFDKLSSIIDSGEMSMLIKGTSSLQTRSLLSSFIRNHENNNQSGNFNSIINGEEGISILFSFLSEYINYRLCYEEISSSLLNYSPNICFNLNSKYDDNSEYFTDDQIDDQIADLTKMLDDICKNKIPGEFNILDNGPTILTTNFVNLIVNSISSAISALDQTPSGISNQSENKPKITVEEIYQLYKTAELNPTLKRIEDLKNRSSYILKTIFDIGESHLSYGFNTTAETGQTYFETTSNNGGQYKFYYWLFDTSKIPTDYYYPNNQIIYENFILPNELYDFSQDFLKPIEWVGEKNKEELSSKARDNQVTSKYFNSINKVPQHVNVIWNSVVSKYPIIDSKTYNLSKPSDAEEYNKKLVTKNQNWMYDLYNYANYHKPFINAVLEPISSQDDQFIKESFELVQKNPSLKEYFKFAVKIYNRAYQIELEVLGESTSAIEEQIAPWLKLESGYLSSFEYKKIYTNQEIKDRVNNLGNFGLKTEDGAVNGYLDKYQLFRNTKTKIYDSKYPGELPDGPIQNFIEEK